MTFALQVPPSLPYLQQLLNVSTLQVQALNVVASCVQAGSFGANCTGWQPHMEAALSAERAMWGGCTWLLRPCPGVFRSVNHNCSVGHMAAASVRASTTDACLHHTRSTAHMALSHCCTYP